LDMAWFGQHNQVDNVEEFEKKAIENAELSHQRFQRSIDFIRSWLQKSD